MQQLIADASFLWLAAREHVVGWYSTGPRLKEADLDINHLISKYCDNPVLVICEVEVSIPEKQLYRPKQWTAFLVAGVKCRQFPFMSGMVLPLLHVQQWGNKGTWVVRLQNG